MKTSDHHFLDDGPSFRDEPSSLGDQHNSQGSSDGDIQTGSTLSAGQVVNYRLGPEMFGGQRQNARFAGSQSPRFMAATDEEPATADYRELSSRIDADLHDLRDTAGFEAALDANDYAAAQSLAHELRWNHASDGIVYPSVRHPAGAAVAAFWPDVAGLPVPGRHLCCRWDGRRVDAWLVYGEADWRPR